jgi:hypothetical protein
MSDGVFVVESLSDLIDDRVTEKSDQLHSAFA